MNVLNIIDDPAFIKIVDLLIGVFGLIALLYRRKSSPDDISKRDLIQQIKAQEREIERLEIQRKAWKMRHDHLHKKTCEPNHCVT